MTAACWSFACPDWTERLAQGRSLVPSLPLYAAAAERAVKVFDRLRVPDVPGQPAMAEAAGDWFRDIIRALFGSIDPEGVRHVPEVFGLVPKKNAKTTNGAGLMLTALLLNSRPRAEFLLVGPTQEIADLAFQQAAGMIEADEEGYLSKRFHTQEHKKTIRDRFTGALLRIKTFDMKVATGTGPVGILLDELHVMSAMSHAQRVLGQLRGGLLAKPEGFLVMISTQSDEPPAGVFKAELQYARGVRDGRITDQVRTLPVIYEFPEAMQTDPTKPWQDSRTWPLVLPNLGRSITLDRLRADYAQAREKGEEEERRWASQHLNVEIGLALHADRWRGADWWLQAGEAGMTLEAILERSEVVTVGIDGGGLDDLMGVAVLGRERETQRWLLWARGWVQADVLELRKDIAPRLRDFAGDGDLVLCNGPVQDVDEIADLVQRLAELGLLPQEGGVGLDPVGVAAIVDALVARRILPQAQGGPVCAVGQGYRLSGAILGMERKLKDGTLRHCGQPLLAWCAGNAKAVLRGSATVVEKATAGKAKIDPLIAAFNAFFLMSRNPSAARTLPADYELTVIG